MTEDEAFAALCKRRWPQGTACPHCSSARVYEASRRRFRCAAPTCRKDFTITTGTLMHNTHAKLSDWLTAEAMIADGKSIRAVADALLRDENKVWVMCKKIKQNDGALL